MRVPQTSPGQKPKPRGCPPTRHPSSFGAWCGSKDTDLSSERFLTHTTFLVQW